MQPNLLFDRSDRLRLRFSGSHATQTLNGLVTNDLAALKPGEGCYAAVLSSKGKIVADVRLFIEHDSILLDTSAAAAPGLLDFFRKYVNPRFAVQTDVTATLADIGVFGTDARTIVANVTDIPSDTLQNLSAYGLAFDGKLPSPADADLINEIEPEAGNTPITVVHVPDLGVAGYELFVPSALKTSIWDALARAGAIPAEPSDWDARRIAIGWPAWGIDMDENTLPQEANFDELQGISYTKGCYIGQEVVARIHFRGHVNKFLRRLAVDGKLPPPTGADLIDATGKEVGDVRSVTQTDNGVIGIGMVRREIDDGAVLTATWNQDASSREVRVLGKAKGAID
jgi:folate-binding protein YgfZ